MVGYTIIEQKETVTQSPTGGLVDAWKVSFKTEHGTIGSVMIPKAMFSAEVVGRAVQAEADKIDAVWQLGK